MERVKSQNIKYQKLKEKEMSIKKHQHYQRQEQPATITTRISAPIACICCARIACQFWRHKNDNNTTTKLEHISEEEKIPYCIEFLFCSDYFLFQCLRFKSFHEFFFFYFLLLSCRRSYSFYFWLYRFTDALPDWVAGKL